MFSQTCRITEEFGKFKVALIGIYDQISDEIEIFTNPNLQQDIKPLIRNLKTYLEESDNQIKNKINKGDYFICNEISSCQLNTEWLKVLLNNGCHSFGFFPLKFKNDFIGFLKICTAEKNFFDREEIELLTEVVNDISFAIEKIELEKEQVETLKLLQENEEKYRTLFESAYDSIFTMDEAKFIDCNKATLKIFGCSDKSEIINKFPYDFSPKYQPDGRDSKEKALELINKSFAGENQRFYWKHTKKDGTEFDAEVSLNRFKLGEKYFLQAIVRDITEVLSIQEKIKASEEKYRLISTVASDYMFSSTVNENGSLQLNWVAGAFEKITGYSMKEYIDAGGWRARLYPDDIEKDNQDLAKLKKNEKVVTEIRTIRKNGEIVWVRVYA
ncbi:MAG: PAS domain S-box protein, partial [Ignavibacteria bacterium]|nr:PAS domain S-box protein [Ignavibacteria bacterium]